MNQSARPVVRRGKPTRARWTILWLVFLGLAISYIDRANLAVALPYMQHDLGLAAGLGGLLLGGFYWTYSVLQLPFGHAVDRAGPRFLFGAAVLWWSVCTAATSVVSGFGALFGLRLLLGAGEAAAFPASVKAVGTWFPPSERGIATGIYVSGARCGTLLSVPVVTALIGWIGWRSSFIATGALGVVWAAVWVWHYRAPREHRGVSESELALITEGREAPAPGQERPAIPWLEMLRHRNVLAVSLGYFCITFVEYFFITWFPSYLVQDLGFTLLQLGVFGTIPAFSAILGQWSGGYVADALVRRGLTVTRARKSCIVGGALTSSVIAVAAFVRSPGLALALLSISTAALTFADASVWCLPADLSPRDQGPDVGWEGSIAGIVNGISNLAGIASPAVIGLAVGMTHSFVFGLVTAGVLAIVAVLIFVFGVGPIEPLRPGNSGAESRNQAESAS